MLKVGLEKFNDKVIIRNNKHCSVLFVIEHLSDVAINEMIFVQPFKLVKKNKGVGKNMSNTLKIYMLAFISFLAGTVEFVISGILDKVADSANVSVSTAGQLITIFSISFAFGSPIIMMAAAKMDRRKLLMLSLLTLALGSVLTATLSGFTFLIISRVILALGTGVFLTTAMTVAPKLAAPNRQAGAIATVLAGTSSALILGVPIGRVVASAYDWKVIFWGIGFLSLLGIFAIAKTIPATNADTPVPLRQQLAFLKRPNIAMAFGITFFVFAGYSVLNTFLTPFLSNMLGMSERGISITFFALGIVSLIGSKIGGFFTDRFGSKPTLISSVIAQIISLVLLSIILSSTSGSVVIEVILLMLWATSAWIFATTQNFNLTSLAPEASGIMLSLNTSFIHIGIAVGAAVGGIVVGSLSMLATSWIGAVSAVIAMLIAAISFRITRPAKKNVPSK
ncbi:MFS transporter [Priestia aryabhattai]|uniref:MFS transporter n=1 Tax=Priestia TaxID=2800373 RepID=UPI002079CE12|nr:MFS transporter [Priestia megaterium]USL39630.1 MFS transporter [Priestia megaterium]